MELDVYAFSFCLYFLNPCIRYQSMDENTVIDVITPLPMNIPLGF